MKSFFVFDVESIGLHGEGFAVAGGVYLSNGASQWEFCYACPTEEAQGFDVKDREWVNVNVPSLDITHRNPRGIRDAFWLVWMKAKEQYPDIVMAAECGWPVEASFLNDCISDDMEDRRWKGPYPLMEIASYMDAVGMDPMAKYNRTSFEMPEHNPLTDARLSARLLSEALSKLIK